MDIIGGYDVVVNCSGQLSHPLPDQRRLRVRARSPWWTARSSSSRATPRCSIRTNGGPCYRCLYPEPPPPGMAPSCAEAGVLGVLPGLIGSIEALEAIKLILGVGKPLIGTMVYFDTLSDRDYRPPDEDQARSGMPGVRRPSDADQADRLRGVLRPGGQRRVGQRRRRSPQPSGASRRGSLRGLADIDADADGW